MLVNSRLLILAGISAALILLLFHNYDFHQVRLAAAQIPLATLCLVVIALFASTVLSCVRYQEVLSTLGIQIPMRLAIHAQLVGIVGGLMFFQVIGQTLARTAVLDRYGVRGPAVLFANLVERLTAMLWLSALMAVGVLYLFGKFTLHAQGELVGEVKLAAVLLLVATATVIWGCPRLVRVGLRHATHRLPLGRLARVSCYSIVTHQLTMVAFVLLGHSAAPKVSLLDLAAASLIVMFAASVPISFAGWGLREISAVYAYQAVGISVEKALAVSILVGLISLLLVLAMSFASSVFGPRSVVVQTEASLRSVKASANITRGLSWAVPLLCGALIFFQVHVPVSGGAVNVNLADPLAIAGGFIFLSRYLGMPTRASAWRVSGVELFVLAGTLSLGFGLLLGWARFGLTDWALYSRFFGWFVLLGYAATGALIVGQGGELGRVLLLRGVLLAGFTIAVTEIVSLLLVATAVAPPGLLSLYNLAGMAQNANAFAIQMITVIAISCAGICALPGKSRRTQDVLSALVIAISMTAVFFARSRTGYIVTGATLLLALSFSFVSWRVAIGGVLGAIATGFAIFLIITVTSSSEIGTNALAMKLQAPSSDGERLRTLNDGLKMWLDHPILGAGLGAFAESTRVKTGTILVIHSTGLWLLAELGLVGFCTFLAFFGRMAVRAFCERKSAEPGIRVLVLTICSAALFQLPHDILYQRIYWLLIGTVLFLSRLQRLDHTANAPTP